MATLGVLPANDVKIYFGVTRIAKITTARLSISTSVRDTTNRDTENYVTGEYGLISWNISGSSHLSFEDGFNIFDLFRLMKNKTKPTLTWTTEVDGDEQFAGRCIIESLESGGGVGDNETYDFTFRGDGAIVDSVVDGTAGWGATAYGSTAA
jgi:hypothetical protein